MRAAINKKSSDGRHAITNNYSDIKA